MRTEARAGVITVALLSWAAVAGAVPLGGAYTVGGVSPTFATLQHAADSLMAVGVWTHVEVRIRPGTYLRNGGIDRVLDLSAPIPGAGPGARIRFVPDAAAGGTVENVILGFDGLPFNGSGPVRIRADYVELHALTFEDFDVGEAGAFHLVDLIGAPLANLFLEGIVIADCRFVGNSNPTTALGTDLGIHGFDDDVADILVRGNRFERIRRAITIGTDDPGDVAGTLVVEDDTIVASHRGFSGSGNPLGHGIALGGRRVEVRGNLLDFSDGQTFEGITVRIFDSGVIDRNIVRHSSDTPFIAIHVDDYFFHDSDSALVSNNMVSDLTGGQKFGMILSARRTRMFHNSIVIDANLGSQTYGVQIESAECSLLNNIVDVSGATAVGFHPLYEISSAAGPSLVSDFNILRGNAAGPFARVGGTPYASLGAFQAATGLDANTTSDAVEFVHRRDDLHLTDCASQDPALLGTAVAGVPGDIDDEPRIRRLRGADEVYQPVGRLFETFDRIGLPGTPFAIDAGRFDDPDADGLAVADYDNQQVHLFHNEPATRVFSAAGSLGVPFAPTAIRFTDFDEDGNQDLIVAGEDANIVVFWGDGAGGFPDSTVVPTFGRVVSIEPEPSQYFLDYKLCFLSMDNGFLPNSSWLGVLVNQGGRNLCSDIVHLAGGDTLFTNLKDLAVASFGGQGAYQVAGIGLGPGLVGRLAMFDDLAGISSVLQPCNHVYFDMIDELTAAPIASYGGHAAALIDGDFDGDGDQDLFATGFSDDRPILLRNDGAAAFQPESLEVNDAVALAKLDYEGDGDLDLVTLNRSLEDNGITFFQNDGAGGFRRVFQCFSRLGTGVAFDVVARDFDLDGRTDLAIATSADSFFVLYNAATSIAGVRPPRAIPVPRARLEPCAPNPVLRSARIAFTISERMPVRLAVFDAQGRRVTTLVEGVREAGRHEVRFVPGRIPSGVYLVKLEAGRDRLTRKTMVVR